jgi:hypothetical protein
VEEYSTARQMADDIIIWRMRIACWILKATNIHSEYVILIAFPLQELLYERALMLRYMFIAHILHYNPRHVSSNTMLIIRGSNCIVEDYNVIYTLL